MIDRKLKLCANSAAPGVAIGTNRPSRMLQFVSAAEEPLDNGEIASQLAGVALMVVIIAGTTSTSIAMR